MAELVYCYSSSVSPSGASSRWSAVLLRLVFVQPSRMTVLQRMASERRFLPVGVVAGMQMTCFSAKSYILFTLATSSGALGASMFSKACGALAQATLLASYSVKLLHQCTVVSKSAPLVDLLTAPRVIAHIYGLHCSERRELLCWIAQMPELECNPQTHTGYDKVFWYTPIFVAPKVESFCRDTVTWLA